MANSNKNIVITPNIGSSVADPKIVFSGGNTTVNTNISLQVYPDANGTLSFEGSSGQLFSIVDNFSNSIFSVNDISGIPSIDVFANGQINFAPFGGSVAVGTSTVGYPDSSRTSITVNGTSSSMHIFQTGNSNRMYLYSDASTQQVVAQTGSLNFFTLTATPMLFYTNNQEHMRIDSAGNVGIGAIPANWWPSIKALQVGARAAVSSSTATGAFSYNTFYEATVGFKYLANDFALEYRQNNGNGSHAWFTAPSGTGGNAITFSQMMTLDVNGNFGLSIIPSAWNFSGNIEVPQYGSITAQGPSLYSSTNCYYNGSWIYKTTGFATQYYQNSGFHQWHIAAGGTAGGVITWNQAMTLAANGNLGIASTSPNYRLTVSGSGYFANPGSASATPITGILLGSPGSNINDASPAIKFDVGGGGGGATIYTTRIGGAGGNLIFATDNTSAVMTERMRIGATGLIGVGTTNPQSRLHIEGTSGATSSQLQLTATSVLSGYLGPTANGLEIGVDNANILFRTGVTGNLSVTTGTERMRITSTGSVVVGSAAIATSATDGFLYIPTCAGTPTGTPTAQTGRAPLVIDSTNNKLYMYSGGAWVALN